MDSPDGLDGLDLGDGGRPDATEVELVPVGEAQPSQPRTSGVNRKRAAIAAAAILASAVLISRAGETVPTATALRTADFSGPELTSADEDEDQDADEVDRYELPSWLEDEDIEAWPYDDELALGEDDFTINTFDTYDTYDTIDPFDDAFDFDSDYDTLPRRSSSTGSSRSSGSSASRSTGGNSSNRTTTSTTTSTTVAATTTTAAETTTTASGSSTSDATTTTTPPPAWNGAVSGLGSVTCAQPLHVLPRMNSLLASVAGSGLYTNTAGTWTALPSAVAGTGEQRALVQTDADTYWIGGADGVFRRDDGAGDFAEIGDLTDVRALSVYVSPANQATMYATAGAGLTLYRWVDGSEPAWTPISMNLPSGAGIAGHPLVLDGMVGLLGTSAGVYRTLDGGQTWVPTNPGGVTGPPLARADGIYWLLAGGQGLIRSTDNGLTWSSVVGAGQIHPNANRLAQLPDGSLLTVGMETGGTRTLLKITLSAAGATSAPYGPLLPYVPSGIAHSGTATYIWSSTCTSGSDAANAIVSLADP